MTIMRRTKYISTPFWRLLLLAFIACSIALPASAQRPRRAGDKSSTQAEVASSIAPGDEAELKQIVLLPPAERIEKLKAFIEAHPESALKSRAQELIVSARASLGDEKLKSGDMRGGAEQFRLAVTESPANMSDKLYTEIISTLPLNLFLRGERAAALETARLIEERVKDDPKRLLTLASFYLNIEEAGEATRISELAIKLAPGMAATHQALGAAYHIALRLTDAANEYDARDGMYAPPSGGSRKE